MSAASTGTGGRPPRRLTGSCHCGATKFEVPHQPTEMTSCTCSYCAKTGGLWAYYAPEDFKLLMPEADRGLYRWNSQMIEHYFCPVCGCSTYGVSPEWVDMNSLVVVGSSTTKYVTTGGGERRMVTPRDYHWMER